MSGSFRIALRSLTDSVVHDDGYLGDQDQISIVRRLEPNSAGTLIHAGTVFPTNWLIIVILVQDSRLRGVDPVVSLFDASQCYGTLVSPRRHIPRAPSG